MSKWVQAQVVGIRHWTDRLHSLQVAAPEVTFIAGQFARVALPAPPGSKEEMLGRPYSFVNAPGTSPHEFYFITVEQGPLSVRLAALSPGDPVWLLRTANGFFTVAETPDADALWCLSTGTGIGPFLSILRSEEAWEKFRCAVLVHAVRHAFELTYRDVIGAIASSRVGRFTYVPIVSRELHPGALGGRIPDAIRDGRLETRVGIALTADNAHAMLCGNPAMVDDAQKALEARGMRRHRRREPGHVTIETYW
jgi:ferredoxin/flavodoxin---NADP+ reductase